MLTANIYNVAAIRTIALHRAARAVGMLFTLVAAFFLINVLLSLHLAFYLNFLGVIILTGPLYLVQLWSYGLEDYVTRKVALYTFVFTLVTGQMAAIFSFWPLEPINGALILVTVMYVLLGIGPGLSFFARAGGRGDRRWGEKKRNSERLAELPKKK